MFFQVTAHDLITDDVFIAKYEKECSPVEQKLIEKKVDKMFLDGDAWEYFDALQEGKDFEASSIAAKFWNCEGLLKAMFDAGFNKCNRHNRTLNWKWRQQ